MVSEKDELSEKIAKGVYEGVGKIIGEVITSIFIGIVIVIIGIFALNWYSSLSYEQCIIDGTCVVQADSYDCFPLKNLKCNIIIENQTGYYPLEHYEFSICGYQEANAYFEHIRPQIELMFEEYNLTMKVIRIECW